MAAHNSKKQNNGAALQSCKGRIEGLKFEVELLTQSLQASRGAVSQASVENKMLCEDIRLLDKRLQQSQNAVHHAEKGWDEEQHRVRQWQASAFAALAALSVSVVAHVFY